MARKTLFCFFLILIMFFSIPAEAVFAAAIDTSTAPDLSGIEDYLNQLDRDIGDNLDGFSLTAIWRGLLSGEIDFSFKTVINSLLGLFFREVMANGALLGELIVLAVICLVLSNLQKISKTGDIAVLSRSVIYLLLFSLTIGTFSLILFSAKEAVETMSNFLYALLPILMTLLASMGGISSVSILNPALLFALSFLLNILQSIIFPIVYFSAVLRLVGYLSPRFNLHKLAGLFKDVAIGILSICLTIFIAVLSFLGLAGASMDGLAIKAAKAASGVFIPVVGRSLADAFDSVMGVSLILKNAIGVIGVIAILLICAIPAAKILAQFFIYRIAAAVIEPLGEEQLAEAFNGLASSTLLLFAVVAAAGLLFFFVLAITVGVGNLTMMMR